MNFPADIYGHDHVPMEESGLHNFAEIVEEEPRHEPEFNAHVLNPDEEMRSREQSYQGNEERHG